MDRRSFLTALIGGMAAAGTGGVAMANAAGPTNPTPIPPHQGLLANEDLPADQAEALDDSDAGFSQYRRRRFYRRYYRPRVYRRRFYRRRVYRPRFYYGPRRRYYRRYW